MASESTSPIGIEVPAVSSWLLSHIDGLLPPLSFELIAGGRSNLTYRVRDRAGRSIALRRPPLSHVLPTAHDMLREHTILSALGSTGLPVPATLGLCSDDSVSERPFYVMEFVEGHILRDVETVESAFSVEQRGVIGPNLARTLAQLHHIDVDAVGLGDLARHEGYVGRQIKRWRGQYQQMQVEGVDHAGLVEAVGDALQGSIPPQQRISVVHGDYRLDNTVLDDEGMVKAILDWEICTLGDPLADLGLLLDYWAEPDDDAVALLDQSPTIAPGFCTRAELLTAYADVSSLDLSQIDYYRAFGYWKLACILQGVYARYRAGARAGDESSVETFPDHIDHLAETAQAMLQTVSS
jgi:aminoglycoside phosphotransferase (APT) family kinase protein